MTIKEWLIIIIDILVASAMMSTLVIVATYKKSINWKTILIFIAVGIAILVGSALVVAHVVSNCFDDGRLEYAVPIDQQLHILDDNSDLISRKDDTIEWRD